MLIALLYILWNGMVFSRMGLDKRYAQRGERRIPERRFFLWGLCFGAAGGLLGMYVFRHKTRHVSFVAGMPVLLLFNILSMYALAGR